MKTIVLTALTTGLLLISSALGSEPVPEGNLEPFIPRIAALKNPASQVRAWGTVRQFLEKDNSNEHRYSEDSYDCKHFALELLRRANQEGIACGIILINYADRAVGHCEVEFLTLDRGVVYVDFTPATSGNDQAPSKCIDMVSPGERRIQVPLSQVPENFTNTAAFFYAYLKRQDQLRAAEAKLRKRQREVLELRDHLDALEQSARESARARKELEAARADYEEQVRRLKAAEAIVDEYVRSSRSPYDLTTAPTVANFRRY